MNNFLLKVIGFITLLVLFIGIGATLPATPRAKASLLFAKPAKDSLLRNTKSPRIIFIGGSNISMSLNSQTIKDSLHLNPVNTGLHAAIGLVYMLDNTVDKVRKGDLIVVVPEYDHLFGNFAYGSQELLRIVLDVRSTNVSSLRWKQIKNIFEFLPSYSLSKFKLSEYFKSRVEPDIYLRTAFNQYGDCNARHKNHPPNKSVFGRITGPVNPEIIEELRNFNRKVTAKGAKMLMSFPAFEERSYDNSAGKIKEVEKAYRDNGFTVIGNPEIYRFPNTLMYDTPYHLSDEGVAIRTQMLVKELLHEIKKR